MAVDLDATVQALANLFATVVLPDLGGGYCYDTADDNPTPDALSGTITPPTVLFFAPYQWQFELDGRRTFGAGRQRKAHTILSKWIWGPWSGSRRVSYAKRARHAPDLIYAAVAQANTLNGTCWKAEALTGSGGVWPAADGQLWWALDVPVVCEYEDQVSPHS